MNAIELNHQNPYATPEEIEWLKKWATENSFSKVIMIGAGPGVMAVAILETGKHIVMAIVDKVSCQYAKAHIKALSDTDGEFRPVRYFEMDSVEYAIALAYDNRKPFLDFLIIDGDHSYEGVKRDLDAWLPHMKPNSLIFLHDYDAEGTIFANVERYPGVKQAVEECSAHWEEYARVGTAIVMRVLA